MMSHVRLDRQYKVEFSLVRLTIPVLIRLAIVGNVSS